MSAFGGPQIVSDGLLIYYDAANPRSYVGSATSCFDLSGFNNTGNLSSGISFSSGVSGNFIFGATTSFINTGFVTTLSTSFTINMWYTTNPQVNSVPMLFSKSSSNATATTDAPINIIPSSNGRSLTVGLRNGLSYAANYPVGGVDLTATNIFSASVWANLVIKYDQINLEVWANGNYFTGIAWTGTLSNNPGRPYYLGRAPFEIAVPANNTQYSGNIAIFQMYSRSLSTSEIQQNFQAQRGRFGI